MNALTEKLSLWWSGLSNRDQRTLILAIPLIVLLLAYLLIFQPIHNRFTEVRERKIELADSITWLYENAALVERLQNQCSRQRMVAQDDDLLDFARSIGRRAGATPQLRPGRDNQLVATVEGTSGNRAVGLVQAYTCHGFVVSDLQITRKAVTDVSVDVSLTLSPSNLLVGG